MTNQGTGLEVVGVTDETGAYAIRNLQPGTYTVKASLQGFKEYVQTGVPVNPNDVVRIDGKLRSRRADRVGDGHDRSRAAQDRQG